MTFIYLSAIYLKREKGYLQKKKKKTICYLIVENLAGERFQKSQQFQQQQKMSHACYYHLIQRILQNIYITELKVLKHPRKI